MNHSHTTYWIYFQPLRTTILEDAALISTSFDLVLVTHENDFNLFQNEFQQAVHLVLKIEKSPENIRSF